MIKCILNKAIDLIRLHHLIQMILSLAAKILIYNNFFLFSPFFLFFLPFHFLFSHIQQGEGAFHLQRGGGGGHGALVPPATGLDLRGAQFYVLPQGPVWTCYATVKSSTPPRPVPGSHWIICEVSALNLKNCANARRIYVFWVINPLFLLLLGTVES